jgi:hypothetical protein
MGGFPASAGGCRVSLARGLFYTEDGSDTFIRNVGSHKMYTATDPRKRHSYFYVPCKHPHEITNEHQDCCCFILELYLQRVFSNNKLNFKIRFVWRATFLFYTFWMTLTGRQCVQQQTYRSWFARYQLELRDQWTIFFPLKILRSNIKCGSTRLVYSV